MSTAYYRVGKSDRAIFAPTGEGAAGEPIGSQLCTNMEEVRATTLPADILPIRPNCDEDGIRLRDQDQIKEEAIIRGEGK